jgi:hypothetical protein
MEDYLKRVLGVSASGVLLFSVGVTFTPGIWPFGLVYGFLIPFLGLGFLFSGVMTILYAEHLVTRDGKRYERANPFLKLEEHLVEGYATQATAANGDIYGNKPISDGDQPDSKSFNAKS